VVATSPQLLCALAGYVVSVLKRKPFVFEVRDLWPKQIIDLGAVRNPIIIGLLTWAEMFLYRRAKAIVTVSPATADEIAARGIPRDKLFTVTNGINERFFAPRGRLGPLRDTYVWNDDIVVMYIGTHGLSQGLTTIIETAEMLQDREDIRFVFAGQGAEREMLMEMVHAKKLRNVQFLPMQTKEKMPEFYAAADICLVPLKKRDYFLYNIPSKMFEIMACARPIILGVEGQSLEILNEASAGVAVDPENARAYADAIRKLADDPELRASYGKNGCEYVLRHYTRKQKAEQYLEYLQRVVDKKRASG
ncbi:MAG TPA: glycosyltransferase family 4 protein, partial [Candidatus Hydrogenedentes bacterium]|nr:glycosyltransferase family 4 protein [Candidatus Hydrogenedentota bacterium]